MGSKLEFIVNEDKMPKQDKIFGQIFSEFFAVDTQKKADYFMRKYSNNELAMNLVYEYNKASPSNVSDKGDVYMSDRTIKSWKDIASITAEEINAKIDKKIKRNR
jgi:hypothetical protein